MTTERPYNAHFELAPTGHVAFARSCGDGWWEDWVYACDREWRRLAELLLDGRAHYLRRPGARPTMSNTGKTFAAVILWVAQLAAAVGCTSSRVQPPVADLRRGEVFDLLEHERSVAVVREPPAPLRVPSSHVGGDMALFGLNVMGIGALGVGAPLLAAGIPIAIAEGATESRREQRLEPLVVDPIPAVEQRLVSALRAEPALSGIEWKTGTSECGSGSCGSALSLRLRTTERGVCASQGWMAYGAELQVVRTEGAEVLWQRKCLRIDRAASIELPGAFSKDQQEAFAKHLQSRFDTLAAECGGQLVTSLLGRGAALSDAPPPACR